MSLLQKIAVVFKDKQLRNKVLFVLAILVVFRFAANIPVPGVDTEQLKAFFDGNQFFGLWNLFVGGTMSRLSIIMLGLGPYITSVIIMQLLTMIFPRLEKLYKEEGEAGRQKINQYGRYLTVPLAILQSYAMLSLLQKQGALNMLSSSQMVMSILTITAGSVFLMWLGELITEKGIGNGVSLLIFAGILSGVPNEAFQFIKTWDSASAPSYLLFFGASLLIIAGVIFVTEARRNIPVSYAKRVRGNKMYGGVSTYLPININQIGRAHV